MPEVTALTPLSAAAVTIAILVVGAYVAEVIEQATSSAMAGRSLRGVLLEPVRGAALLLRQDTMLTERPDILLWIIAPAAYAGVAAGALAVVPLSEGLAVADVRTGIVVFGAFEALAIVAIFLHGWAPNSHLPLLGGFRFVGVALSYELLSMFVLIAAALPAESLQVSAVVEAQAEMWNVVRQPLGLPLWVIVTLGVTFTGPMNLVDGRDLAGGSSLEASGRQLLLWKVARGGMLTVFSGMGAAAFLGGYHGPLLPGWGWMLIKTTALMALVTWIGARFGRIPAERAVLLLWTIGLPLAFVGLLAAGIEALL